MIYYLVGNGRYNRKDIVYTEIVLGIVETDWF